MDKIWDRNPSKSEVIGRCGLDEQTEWSCRTDKSRTLNVFAINVTQQHDLTNNHFLSSLTCKVNVV